jgi:Gram-negative bacterial TonB protein C-terminal/CarboxypepD_reg-like domain
MSDKEKNIIYTAQDIEQYLTGKLTPLQMHTMEKAALDDDFLAEAMEGYGTMQPADWKNELAAVKDKFDNTNHTAKVVALPKRNYNWWKAAAAVLLLGGGAVTSYLLVNKNDRQEIAQTVKKEAVAVDSAAPVASTEVAILTDTPADELKQQPKTKIIVTNKNTATTLATTEPVDLFDSSFVYTPAPAKPKAVDAAIQPAPIAEAEKSREFTNTTNALPPSTTNNAAEGIASNRNAANQLEQYNKATTDSRKETSRDKDRQQQNFNQSFRAQVVGPDNTPLPFSNITVKEENFGTYADIKGNFSLVSTDSLIAVEVKSVGYQPRQFILRSNVQQNTIVLAEEDVTYKKRTVVGNANTMAKTKAVSRRATLLKDSVVNVEPADGWDNYNTYVDNNIEIPDDILKKNIHGQVELSFDVKPNGTIANIKVDKSLCDDCDEVAKRLIEQGPQWKVKKGKKGKGKVTVQF